MPFYRKLDVNYTMLVVKILIDKTCQERTMLDCGYGSALQCWTKGHSDWAIVVGNRANNLGRDPSASAAYSHVWDLHR